MFWIGAIRGAEDVANADEEAAIDQVVQIAGLVAKAATAKDSPRSTQNLSFGSLFWSLIFLAKEPSNTSAINSLQTAFGNRHVPVLGAPAAHSKLLTKMAKSGCL